MLIGTNDGIVGLDTVELPTAVNESKTLYANGYDVGTEQNTEVFADMVPPAKTLIVGGEPEGTTESDPAIAEDDVIRPHTGIQGVGDMDPAVYDWREPAALVQVERIDGEGPPETPGETPEETPAEETPGETPEEETPEAETPGETPEEETPGETPGLNETGTPEEPAISPPDMNETDTPLE
jgi:hypothetical protein